MILAELEFFHSRPIAPTRRVALGGQSFPLDTASRLAGVLLGGVVAADVRLLARDLVPDLVDLTIDLEDGDRVSQPRLCYRFQTDRVGLLRSHLRLVGTGGGVDFDFDPRRSTPAQRVLAAVYAAGRLGPAARPTAFSAVRRGMCWRGPIGPSLVAHLSGALAGAAPPVAVLDDPVLWALEVLGLSREATAPVPEAAGNGNGDGQGRGPRGSEVQRRFRELVRRAHPDHGGDADGAARRIADLREARRILLA